MDPHCTVGGYPILRALLYILLCVESHEQLSIGLWTGGSFTITVQQESTIQLRYLRRKTRTMRAVRTICQDVAKSVGRDINLGAVRLALLMWADFLWSQTVINAFNVASWRGVWGLWEALFDYLFEVTTYSSKAKSSTQI